MQRSSHLGGGQTERQPERQYWEHRKATYGVPSLLDRSSIVHNPFERTNLPFGARTPGCTYWFLRMSTVPAFEYFGLSLTSNCMQWYESETPHEDFSIQAGLYCQRGLQREGSTGLSVQPLCRMPKTRHHFMDVCMSQMPWSSWSQRLNSL